MPAPSSRCKIIEPEGTFLYAHYPRPVSGCAAEVSQRIAEAVFAALTKAIPDLLFAAPAGTSGNLGVGGYDPEREPQLHHVSLHRRRLRRLPGRRRPQQRLLDHRHLQDAAGRGAGAVLSRCCSRSSRCAKARAAPASIRGGFGINYAHQAAPRRGAGVDGDGPRPHRPAGRAGRRGRRRQHRRGERRAARPTGRRISPRTRTSRSASATWCACRRRAAAASAIRPGASPRRSPATSRAATTARPRRARSSASGKPRNEACETRIRRLAAGR